MYGRGDYYCRLLYLEYSFTGWMKRGRLPPRMIVLIFSTFYVLLSSYGSLFTRQGVCIPALSRQSRAWKVATRHLMDGLDPAKDGRMRDGVNECIKHLVLL